MSRSSIGCLILACGNTLRGDDGIGPCLAEWAAEHLGRHPGVRVICRQQWTPELAEEIATAQTVVFVDSSALSAPGAIQLVPIEPAQQTADLATHHIEAAQLLSLCRELYGTLPSTALLLTIGIGSTEFGAEFSPAVQRALPQACALLQARVLQLTDQRA